MTSKPIPERYAVGGHRFWRAIAEELFAAEAALSEAQQERGTLKATCGALDDAIVRLKQQLAGQAATIQYLEEQLGSCRQWIAGKEQRLSSIEKTKAVLAEAGLWPLQETQRGTVANMFWRIRSRWLIWRYRFKAKLTPRQKLMVLRAQAEICRKDHP